MVNELKFAQTTSIFTHFGGSGGNARRSIDKRINIECDFKAELPVVMADDSLLTNAFLNLGLNAAHAVGGQGTIRFATANPMSSLIS